MKNKKMTPKETIEYLKENNSGCSEFLLDEERVIKNYPPLTDAEIMEWAEYMVTLERTIAAKKYLNSCDERFGKLENGNSIFVNENCTVELDIVVIETSLIHQIEKSILEARPDEKYIALWRFYTWNATNEKENGSTWMRDFIDSIFINGSKLFTAEPVTPTAH